MNNSKLIGGIMLIIGTCIGGGILALPMTTAPSGFFASTVLLFVCWLLMTVCAFLILEVNLWLPEDSNMVSMAKLTLGRGGQVIAWLAYAGLLYSLLCAYLSGGMDVAQKLLADVGIKTPIWIDAVLVTFIIGLIVYFGVKVVDYANRGLLSVKLILFIGLILVILPHTKMSLLPSAHYHKLLPALMVVITSFGYATIIPTLRSYFKSDVKSLRKAIFIGSLIPLFFYILWDFTVQATHITTSEFVAMSHSVSAVTTLTADLMAIVKSHFLDNIVQAFTSISIATSFLGVSLCLVDFLADGFKIKRVGFGKLSTVLMVFLPPLLIVLVKPDIFVEGLRYAGTFCVVLLMLLPSLMAYSGRYIKGITAEYRVVGGKSAIILITVFALAILVIAAQNL